VGHTSKIALGFSVKLEWPPASITSKSIIAWVVVVEKAPVTTGFEEYNKTMNNR
jgi:hypothetical protein